ncbi:GMC oxidoreductase [Thermocoleostomius sinensis]|uniref:GMC family oxidoreductase n=1 Tax=Thermocoleostomius sinensis A174 TaxID=2016057 RepID=A0A9E8Z9D8_9CYAN|nr:GMC family oxidoreductase [Thermocoleostomius sinensis]WAL58945.1 GMC family oxidoreductase [Thermocoleostomius sinensis A174]
MIIDDQYYDLIIIGTGAGGGTLVHKLAPTGKKILVLERGETMPLEEQNRSNVDIFRKERYHAPEQWYDSAGEPFSPQTNYAVGGNTKIYGAALLRMRERDFETVTHQEGVSPEWCVKYADFEPYYTAAEQLYLVHGQSAIDPTEPPRSADYPYPAVAHDPCMQPVVDAIAEQGLHPVTMPLGLTRQQDDPTSDSEVCGLVPALKYDNVTLRTSARVVCLHTNPSGRVVKAVEAEIGGESYLFLGDIVVLACGAINSAALLLRSANDACPNGIANSSGLVGRNFMKHSLTAVVQLSTASNSGKFPRSVYIHDFYWGDENFSYPMGHIQNTGGLLQDVIFAESPPVLSVLAKVVPGFGLKQLATRSIGWWAQTEDLPNPNNRVRVENDKLYLEYTPNNVEAHDRLVYRWIEVLKAIESTQSIFQRSNIHPRGEAPLQVVANQCGTCRFGTDPATSVLDPYCRAHDLDNLYVVDGSFFPSNASVSPCLTIIANALRVGDHLIDRLK